MVGIKVSGSLVAVICLLAGIAAGQIQAQEATPQVRCKFRRGHWIGSCLDGKPTILLCSVIDHDFISARRFR